MTSVDIVLVLIIAGAFVLGFLWGVIRSLLMLAAWFVVFVLSAILSVPLGDYLSNQWNTYSSDWNHMAAFADPVHAAASSPRSCWPGSASGDPRASPGTDCSMTSGRVP